MEEYALTAITDLSNNPQWKWPVSLVQAPKLSLFATHIPSVYSGPVILPSSRMLTGKPWLYKNGAGLPATHYFRPAPLLVVLTATVQRHDFP